MTRAMRKAVRIVTGRPTLTPSSVSAVTAAIGGIKASSAMTKVARR